MNYKYLAAVYDNASERAKRPTGERQDRNGNWREGRRQGEATLENNTYVRPDPDGAMVVRYWSTDILRVFPDDKTEILEAHDSLTSMKRFNTYATGGWHFTPSTSARGKNRYYGAVMYKRWRFSDIGDTCCVIIPFVSGVRTGWDLDPV